MASITTRNGKGSALTHVELDANFTNLNNGKLEVTTASSTYLPLAGGTLTGGLTFAAGQATATVSSPNIVQLTNSTSSASTTTAATPNSVKSAFDLANAALPKAGGSLTGVVDLSVTHTSPAFTITQSGSGAGLKVTQAGTGDAFCVEDQAADTTPFVIKDDGKVGIGTSAPGTLLHVVGSITGGSFIPASSSVPTNGVYLPAANTVGVATNGTGRLFVNSTGLVGIGTSSPGAKLDVVGSSRVIGTASDVPTLILQAGSGVTDGYSRATVDFLNQAGTSGYRLRGAHDGGVFQIMTNASGSLSERIGVTDAGTTTVTSNASTAPFIAKISTSEVARIDSSGRLGIGTSSPAATLNVNGTCRVQAANSFAGINIRNDNDSSLVTTTSFLDASNNLNTIDGHLFFEHFTNGGSSAAIATTPAGDRLVDRRVTRLIISSAGTTTLNSAAATAPWITQINGAEAARIDSSARLLVGTSTATGNAPLQVIGEVRASTASTQDAVVLAGRAGGSSSYAVSITPTTLTNNRTLTLADGNTTLTAGTMATIDEATALAIALG